jgi:group II intron reverse transcriptase/maturase
MDKLADLENRVKTGSYKAPPVKRVEIPKDDGTTRKLGISTHENKILEKAVVTLVEPALEQEFLDCSYGYRPGRAALQAVKAVRDALWDGHYWVLELDIRKYFDTIPHGLLMEMFSRRIKDGVVNKLVYGWLKAGVLCDGRLEENDEGTPQGGIVSPLLANLYLHEVFDLWMEKDVRPRMKKGMRVVRYADDSVILFQSESDARRVLAVLGRRFEKYGLTLHPEKTKLVDMRKHTSRGQDGKRGTFDFLGFTYYWGRTRKGKLAPRVKTLGKRLRRKLKEVGEHCRRWMHESIAEQQKRLKRIVEGHANYYGVSDNLPWLHRFLRGVERVWRKWLNRRGGKRMDWRKFRASVDSRPWIKLRIKTKLYDLARPKA